MPIIDERQQATTAFRDSLSLKRGEGYAAIEAARKALGETTEGEVDMHFSKKYSYGHGANSSRRSKNRQLLQDAARLLDSCAWRSARTTDVGLILEPMGGVVQYGVTYRTGPRFGQQLAWARLDTKTKP